MYRLCVRGRISEQRVAMTVDVPAALIAAERHPHELEKNQMKPRQFQRSTAEYGSGAARTPRLLHRIRDAAAFARRWAHRKADAAVGTVPAIEDQLHALQPICSAQRLSTGISCGAPAVAVAEVHALDGCDQIGLTPDGDLVETLCQACLATVQWAMATYVGDKREMASRCGTHPVCSTCGRPTGYLRSVFAVRPIGLEGLAW
jgi:hypothetical protein